MEFEKQLYFDAVTIYKHKQAGFTKKVKPACLCIVGIGLSLLSRTEPHTSP